MNEYWICQHCKSLNRAGTGKCYSCKRKYGSEPKQVPVVRSASAPTSSTPGSRPIPGAPPPAGFFTGSSVGQGVVGPGGRPVDSNSQADLPAYLSRPMQGPAFTSTTYLPAEEGGRLPNPSRWLGRRLTAWLAPRQSVSVWLPGYASAGLVALLLVDGALILATLSPAISVALKTASLTEAWAELSSGGRSALMTMGIAFGIIGALALIFFSVFIGLSTHNAGRLGIADLKLTPGPATTCWWKVVWAQLKLAVGFLVPAALLLSGYYLPGLIAALVSVEWAQRSLDDTSGWITKPARHLASLYAKLGLSGSDGSLLGSVWKGCFILANSLAVVAYAVALIAAVAVVAAGFAGRSDLISLRASGFEPAQLAFMIVGLPLLLTAAASLALLVPVSIDLIRRQKSRGTMSRVGRTRSWVEPPGSRSGYAGRGAAGYGAAPQPEREPEAESGYGRPFSGYDDQLVGSNADRDYADRGSADPGYETRERGGYDDRGFGTGDEDRGYETRR